MLLGLDLSHHNTRRGPVDLGLAKESGVSFVIIRATEGVDFEDEAATELATQAEAAGLDFGYYHFATPGGAWDGRGGVNESWDVVPEAHDFLDKVRRLPTATLLPSLDFEWAGMDAIGMSERKRTQWANEWIELVSAEILESSQRAGFYTNPDNLNRMEVPDSILNTSPLWYARWTTQNPPPFDPGWGWLAWSIWQDSDKGSVPGITGRVDTNRAIDLRPYLVKYNKNPQSERLRREADRLRLTADELDQIAAELEA